MLDNIADTVFINRKQVNLQALNISGHQFCNLLNVGLIIVRWLTTLKQVSHCGCLDLKRTYCINVRHAGEDNSLGETYVSVVAASRRSALKTIVFNRAKTVVFLTVCFFV